MRKLAVILVFLSSTPSPAQSFGSLTKSISGPNDSLLRVYYSMRDSLGLYNGRQFYGYANTIEGHAFFGSNELTRGSVHYNKVWYHQVGLFYDIYKDELITRHPPPFELDIILFPERITQFTLNGHTFIYITKDNENVVSNGFYQRVADGKATLLIKRTKLLDEKINNLTVESKFIAKDHFFILKDGSYHPIDKEKHLMAVFKDKRQELLQYKRQQRLRYKANRELFVTSITNYYNQLQ